MSPDDVQEIYADVLRHRILLSYEAEADVVGRQTKFSKTTAARARSRHINSGHQIDAKDRHRRYGCRFCT